MASASASLRTAFTTPVGRLVQGSLYKANTTDAEGRPLTVKSGANAGQARVEYYFALAIPKEPGHTHWSQTEWGAKIWNVGHTAFPGIAQRPDFAWKVEDGDSTLPNKKNKKPCDNEGFPGHWVLRFKSGTAPGVYQSDPSNPGGWVQNMQEGFIKLGYYVQVQGNVDSNKSDQTPGVFLNHQTVAFRAYGQEIQSGPSVAEAGFGAAPLPAGASLTPPPSANPMPAAPPPPPSAPAASHVPTASVPAPPTAPVPVTPNPAFLQVPAAPASTVAAPPPPPPVSATPASPSRTMTAKAGGATYESFISGGWDDARMIAEGYLILS